MYKHRCPLRQHKAWGKKEEGMWRVGNLTGHHIHVSPSRRRKARRDLDAGQGERLSGDEFKAGLLHRGELQQLQRVPLGESLGDRHT